MKHILILIKEIHTFYLGLFSFHQKAKKNRAYLSEERGTHLPPKHIQKRGRLRTQHIIEYWLANRQERAFEIQHGGLIESRAILW
jgi:hypothetical protein